jgi:hypothetical protein
VGIFNGAFFIALAAKVVVFLHSMGTFPKSGGGTE